jgi:hypothetical protein
VIVFGFKRVVGGYRETNSDSRVLRFKPAKYSLYLNCYRPGALMILDGTDEFKVQLSAPGDYVLDCDPSENRNNFSIRRVDRGDGA